MPPKCRESTILINKDRVHFYRWTDSSVQPRRLIFLIHGLMMHGRSFETLALRLAEVGDIVIAPDLRGFGRWHYPSEGDPSHKIDHKKSLEDLSLLIKHSEEEFPGLPLFCIGESLGSHFAGRIASLHPELISGLVLSSPCLRPRMFSLPLVPFAWSELVSVGVNPARKFNLSPFAEKFLEEEPSGLQDYLDDPMSRKSLEILELIDTLKVAGQIALQAVPPQIPILVLRGKNDCICKDQSSKKFIDSLSSKNLTVHSFESCGHLLLQVSDLKEEVFSLLDSVLENWTTKK